LNRALPPFQSHRCGGTRVTSGGTRFLFGRDGKLIVRYVAGEELDSETLLKGIVSAFGVK